MAGRIEGGHAEGLLATVVTVAGKMRSSVCWNTPAAVLGSFPAEHEPMAKEIFAVLKKYAPGVKVTLPVMRPAIDGYVSFRCQWVGKKETKK